MAASLCCTVSDVEDIGDFNIVSGHRLLPGARWPAPCHSARLLSQLRVLKDQIDRKSLESFTACSRA